MKLYYQYRCDSDNFHSLEIMPPANRQDLLVLTGEPIGANWISVPVKWYLRERMGDFPRLAGHVPVLGDQALSELCNLLNPVVEILPLDLDDKLFGNVNAVHILPVLDCLDPKHAEFKQLEDGMIIDIQHYVFLDAVIADVPIFRIKGYEFSACYVSEEFRKIVELAKLEGLIFKPLP